MPHTTSPEETFAQIDRLTREARHSIDAILELRNLYPVAAIWFHSLDKGSLHYPRYEQILIEARTRLDYAGNVPMTRKLKTWLLSDIPHLLRKYRWQFLLSFVLFWGSAIFSFLGGLLYPELNPAFLGAEAYHHYLDQIRQGIKFQNFFIPTADMPLVSVLVFLNNFQVAILTAASGLLFGIGTFYILLKNGFMVGSLSALYFQSAHFIDFESQILQHGVIELTAIALAGGIGFMIGSVFYFPGRYGRLSLLRWRAADAGRLFLLVFLMLVMAGLIEGLITPLHLPMYLRGMVILGSLLIIATGGYLSFRRPRTD